MIRKPYAIGFYPSEKEDILTLFKHFEKEVKDFNIENCFSLVSPHAGYIYSGKLVFLGYYNFKKCSNSNIFVILGPDHNGYGLKFNLADYEYFETPLGKVKINKEINEYLSKYDLFEYNNLAHDYEHSIEVQLPFLQYFYKNFEIVPITISTHKFEDFKKAAKIFDELLNSYDVSFIISSDFTHYGVIYNYFPFGLKSYEELKELVYKYLDSKAIEYIIQQKPKEFYDFVINYNPTICGFGGITTILLLNRKIKGKLLGYYTSNDISNKKEDFFVSYASIILWN